MCQLSYGRKVSSQRLLDAALIKKHHYWPKYIPGNNIISHFAEKGIGESDTLQGMLDNVKFHAVVMKEQDYVMMFMTTYGTLVPIREGKKTLLGEWCQPCEDILISGSGTQPLPV